MTRARGRAGSASPLLVAVAAAIGFALTPIVWRVAVAADAHALHAVLAGRDRRAAAALGVARRRLARGARRPAPAAPGRPRRSCWRRRVFGVALANHGLTLLLIPAVGLFVLAVDRGSCAGPGWSCAALGACFGVGGAAVPRAAAARRAVPRAARLRAPRDLERVLGRRAGPPVPGRPRRAARRPRRAGSARSCTLAFASSACWLLLVPSGFLVAAIRHPRYALLSASPC